MKIGDDSVAAHMRSHVDGTVERLEGRTLP